MDQGVAYLNLMLNNKADFILEYNESSSYNSLKREDVDWSQSRVIFIAPEFTKYQQHAIGFKDLGIQLWEVRKYSNGLLVFNEVKSPSTKEPITTIAKNNPVVRKVTEEIKVYTEDDLLNAVDDKVKEIFSELKTAILNLGTDITIKPTKTYIAFRRHATFSWIHITQSGIRVNFNVKSSQLKDPERIAREAYKGKIAVVTINQLDEIPYTISLIKQAYEKS